MKTTYFQFRVTKEEKERILRNMQKRGFRTFSDFARVTLLGAKDNDD